jgi:hypothetical protein
VRHATAMRIRDCVADIDEPAQQLPQR